MKDIDDLLQKQTPAPKRSLTSDFTQRVISKLPERPYDHPHQRYSRLQELLMKLKHLPRLALLAIVLAASGAVATAGYVTYKWTKPSVTIDKITPNNVEGKREFSITADCGDYYSDKRARYELAPAAQLPDQEIKKIFDNNCKYQAISTFIGNIWKSDNGEEFNQKKVGDITTLYDHNNMFAGSPDANPFFGLTLGKITALSNDKITITNIAYTVDSISEGRSEISSGKQVSRTLKLLPGFEVYQDGKKMTTADIAIGDTVQLVVQAKHKVQYYDDIKRNALGPEVSMGVIGLVKNDIESQYLDQFAGGVGNPAIVNSLAKISGCTNNIEYDCVSLPSQQFVVLYCGQPAADTGPNDRECGINGKSTVRADAKYTSDALAIPNYTLQGRITKIDGKNLTIQTRGSSATATIELPTDAINGYNELGNTNKSLVSPAAFLPVQLGDLVSIDYLQADGENKLTIKPSDIVMLTLVEYRIGTAYLKY